MDPVDRMVVKNLPEERIQDSTGGGALLVERRSEHILASQDMLAVGNVEDTSSSDKNPIAPPSPTLPTLIIYNPHARKHLFMTNIDCTTKGMYEEVVGS